MSLQNAINTPPGEFLKEFEATISQAKAQPTKTGKTFFKAVATDGQFKAYLTSFAQTFEHVEGKRVKFSGMGIRRSDDYQGTPQISIGDKTKWTTVGDGAASQPQQEVRIIKQQFTQGGGTATEYEIGPPQKPRPEGASVGNALTNATQLAVFYDVTIPDLEEFLFKTCSKYLRVSQRLMAGELAPENEDPPF